MTAAYAIFTSTTNGIYRSRKWLRIHSFPKVVNGFENREQEQVVYSLPWAGIQKPHNVIFKTKPRKFSHM